MSSQSIANALPTLSKEDEAKIKRAFREFVHLSVRSEQEGDALPMSEEAAFFGVVKQLMRETLRNERSLSEHQHQDQNAGSLEDYRISRAAGIADREDAQRKQSTYNAILDQRPEWGEDHPLSKPIPDALAP